MNEEFNDIIILPPVCSTTEGCTFTSRHLVPAVSADSKTCPLKETFSVISKISQSKLMFFSEQKDAVQNYAVFASKDTSRAYGEHEKVEGNI